MPEPTNKEKIEKLKETRAKIEEEIERLSQEPFEAEPAPGLEYEWMRTAFPDKEL